MWVPGRYTLSASTPNKNSLKNCWTGGAGKTTNPEDVDPIGAYQKKSEGYGYHDRTPSRKKTPGL
jgi:hypothetical protein